MSPRDSRIKPVEDANHAWLVGQVIGLLLRLASEEAAHATGREPPHTIIEPILDKDDNYMATLRVTRPSGSYLVVVVKE